MKTLLIAVASSLLLLAQPITRDTFLAYTDVALVPDGNSLVLQFPTGSAKNGAISMLYLTCSQECTYRTSWSGTSASGTAASIATFDSSSHPVSSAFVVAGTCGAGCDGTLFMPSASLPGVHPPFDAAFVMAAGAQTAQNYMLSVKGSSGTAKLTILFREY